MVENWIKSDCRNKECFQLLSYKTNKGKGYAVKEGFLKSNSDLVLYTDADGASPIEEIEKLLPWTEKNYDVVVGSRVLQDENSNVTMSILRRLIGRVFHLLLSIFDLANVKDTQCGFKLFSASAAKKFASLQKSSTYTFDVEYLFLAKRLGYKIKEIPVNWYHVEGSKVNLIMDSIKMLVDVLKIRFFYKYNIKEL